MYTAKVIQANNITEHPNADRLNVLHYGGMQFVIGKDVQIGDVVVLFPSDGQLNHDFCLENNLYRDASKNKDNSKSGFFDDNRRVRAQPFRGEKSHGYVATFDQFLYLGDFSPEIGMEFSEWNGKEVCSKYFTPATLRAMRNIEKNKAKDKPVEWNLAEHFDTKRFSYYLPEIVNNTLCIITEKCHGTSARTGRVFVTRKYQNIFQKFFSHILKRFVGKSISQYELVSGTRRTICNRRPEITEDGGIDHYRWEWHEKIGPQLHKGETVYYEIVGWDSLGGTIMERQNLKSLKNRKEFPSYWTDSMVYSYGCEENENDVFVYRITQTNESGDVVELSWNQIAARSKELGLKHVPVLDFFIPSSIEDIQKVVDSLLTDSPSTIDNRHLMEGVCIRLESPTETLVLKEKNFIFGVLEGYLKEDANYIDTEEAN